MSVVLGRNVRIYQGTTGTSPIVAAAKSCTITKSGEVIEKSSSTQASAKEYLPGRSEWSVIINHLVVSEAPFDGIVKVLETYTLRINVEGTEMKGTAICTEASISAPIDAIANGSVKFKGTGELTAV
jgi:predicted secreted protein